MSQIPVIIGVFGVFAVIMGTYAPYCTICDMLSHQPQVPVITGSSITSTGPLYSTHPAIFAYHVSPNPLILLGWPCWHIVCTMGI